LEVIPPPAPSAGGLDDAAVSGRIRRGSLNAWWQPQVARRIGIRQPELPLTMTALILSALEYAPEIRAFADTPLIRETAIDEADAHFDWTAFMDTRWNDISDPVGSTLTTGGPPRYNDHKWDYSFGARRRLITGGRFEVAQRFGYQDNNSIFTIPNPQGTSRLTLGFTQPLLRTAGRVYNTSLVVLAQIETGIAYDELSEQLQTYLLDVSRAYWSLYLERGSYLQKRRSYERAAAVLADLEHRREIDAVTSQVVRARSEVAARHSELIRAATAVRNNESRIRSLVPDPKLGTVDEFELTPLDVPTSVYIPVSMQQSLTTAFQNRPELTEALGRIKGASVRVNMTKNELLPVLDMVLESYVSGIDAGEIGPAWGDQFTEGAPSYTAGLQFEVPIQNRAARARYQRRSIELRQLQQDFQATLEELNLEVEVAVREVETAYREMYEKYDAMTAAASDVDYIEKRWKLLPGADQGASLLLEDLLSSQDRLAENEFNFLTAQVTYTVALIELKRAMGTLLQYEQISLARGQECCLPTILFDKPGQSAPVELFSTPPANGPPQELFPVPPVGPSDNGPQNRSVDDTGPGHQRGPLARVR
jgi:outer membrane protein TolC